MEQKIFLSLMTAYAAHAKKSNDYYQTLDLSTGQPKVLYILHAEEGYLQKDLAKVCKVEPPSMTVLLKNMEKKELVRREKVLVSGGKRAFRIYLTDKGRELSEKVVAHVEEMEKLSFQGFTREERTNLLDLLERVTENLTDE